MDEGRGRREVARHFRVSPRFVNELMKLCREFGSLEQRRQGHAPVLGRNLMWQAPGSACR